LDTVVEFLSRLNPASLFEDPGPVESPLYLNLAFVLAALLILGVFVSARPRVIAGANRVQEMALRRYGGALAWIAGSGLVVVGLRFTNAPFFAKRIWLVLALMSLLTLGVHGLWYRLTQFPRDVAAQAEAERRRRLRIGTPAPSRRRRGRR
jgi:hypothetical protein